MSRKGIEISKAIKEGKWLDIKYNNGTKITYFWCAIKDIKPESKLLIVDMFNHQMVDTSNNGYIDDTKVLFDKIISASVIEETTYFVNEKLLDKIKENYKDYKWLDFYKIDEKVLNYYVDCYNEDTPLYESKITLIDGIDYETFRENINLSLNIPQFKKIVKQIKLNIKDQKKKYNYKKVRLAINALAISSNKGIIPIKYFDLLLDVKTKSLQLNDTPQYNVNIGTFKLSHYIDESIETFIDTFDENKEYFIDTIASNLKYNQKIDENPYIFEFENRYRINLAAQYKSIQNMFNENELTRPLKAFFGAADAINNRRKEYPIILYDDKVNLPQLRVIYNSINQDVTYVQGPPGTGKTTTIFNVLLTSLYNDLTVLITSNNNEAIDGIYRKFSNIRYKDKHIDFPILRLGSNQHIERTLKRIKRIYENYNNIEKDLEKEVNHLKESLRTNMSLINDVLDDYEEREELKQKIDAINNMIKIFEENKEMDEFIKWRHLDNLNNEKEKLVKELNSIKELKEEQIINSLQIDEDILIKYFLCKSIMNFQLLSESRFKQLRQIILMKDSTTEELIEKRREFNQYIASTNNLRKVLRIFPIIISTNLSSIKLGEANPVFDLLIMDEAGQCDVATSLLPLTRAKRALFVGDPNQLKPIILLPDYRNKDLMKTYHIPKEYDYKDNSVLSTMMQVDNLSLYILLKNHYRCSKDIIHFSNQKYYDNQLIINSKENKDSLKIINVEGFSTNKKNTSITEIDAIIDEIKSDYNVKEVGIITPFRNQAELINDRIKKEGLTNVKVGTIHTFQGNEKDKIIISLGVTSETNPKAFDWVKDNKELLNVATTRAKKELVVVSDINQVKKFNQKNEFSDLGDLVNYIEDISGAHITKKADQIFISKVKGIKQFNTKAEQELLDTISHYLTINDKLKIEVKKKITDVLEMDNSDELFHYANQAHFDFVLYNSRMQPLLAIEVMGIEHFTDEQVKERDQKKKKICEKHNLEIFVIKNDYVRRYYLIKDTLLQLLKKN